MLSCCRPLPGAFLLATLVFNAPLFAAADDEAWIEAYLAQTTSAAAPNGARRASRQPVALANLGEHVGRNLRVSLRNGSRRVGQIIAVDAETVAIRARLQGGYAEVQIPRQQILSAETE